MRVLMITQLFQPEPNHLKGLEFAKELSRMGHEVEVLTGFPNYPGGRIYSGYRQQFWQREVIDGIRVTRVPLYADHSSSGFKRILCYVTLAITICFPGLLLVRRPDVVHVYQGPATLVMPAMLLRLLLKIPYVLDIQDLWPESVTSSGMFATSRLSFILDLWCQLTHRFASKIVVLSPGYQRALAGRGVSADKIEVVYNWCGESAASMDTEKCENDSFGLADHFSVVYAGNLGKVQALDAVLEAAQMLEVSHPDVLFVLVGDGVDSERLQDLCRQKKIKNVLFIPRQPVSEIDRILQKAQLLLIHLRDDPLCRIGIPQKTQAYFAAGRPILVAVKGETAELVARAKGGVACEPENAASIAHAVTELHRLTPGMREEMGRNGRSYYERNLCFAVGVKRMETVLKGAAS